MVIERSPEERANIARWINGIEKECRKGTVAARRIGVTLNTWSRWKHGKLQPSDMAMKALESLYEKVMQERDAS